MLSNVIYKMHQIFRPQHSGLPLNWDDEYSELTELEALIQIKDLMSRVDLLTQRGLKGKVLLVMELDEKAYHKIQRLTHNYLIALKKDKKLKASIEVAVYAYLKQLYTNYTLIVADYQHQNKLGFSVETINLILARYLNAIFMMAKWSYFDDQPAPLGAWSHVHQIIKIAEDLSLANRNLFLYDFQHKEMSIATILERGFMLDTLQKESYTPLQFELTDRVLKTWSSNPVIFKEYQKDAYQFFIHLDEDNRPQRLRSAKPHPDFRYWKTTTIVDLIETYLCAVDTRKSLDEFNFITMAGTEDIVSLFRKLRVDWCVKGYKRQRRKEQRHTKKNILNVSYGIDRIYSIVKSLQENNVGLPNMELSTASQAVLRQASDKLLDTSGLENWTMLEDSSSGFAVKLNEDVSIFAQPGALIGYLSASDNKSVAIAEIKNIKKNKDGTFRVGLNKLSSSVIATKLSQLQETDTQETVEGYYVDDGEDNVSYSTEFSGLVLNGDETDKLNVIIPQKQFKRAAKYQLNIHNKRHIVLAGDVIHRNHDWVCFEVSV